MVNENYLLSVILLNYDCFHNENASNYYFTLFSFLCNIYFLFVHTLADVGAEVIPLGLQHDGESHIQKRCEGLHRSVFV